MDYVINYMINLCVSNSKKYDWLSQGSNEWKNVCLIFHISNTIELWVIKWKNREKEVTYQVTETHQKVSG